MKKFSPAADRNKSFIGEVLDKILPTEGTVLEIASGSGQHVAYLAQEFPHVSWQPSELEQDNIESVKYFSADIENIKPCIHIDASRDNWKIPVIDMIVNINMIHISPWSVCEGLFKGANRHLKKDQLLFLYGPYLVEGKETAKTNLEFDRSLKERNPDWGLRLLKDVVSLAESNSFYLHGLVSMPANNYSVVFKKSAFPQDS
jgi:hypothetical protein